MAVTRSYKKRERFAEARARTCNACGKEGLISRKNCGGNFYRVYNIDHIIPISKGGSDTEENLRLLCVSCNTLKSDLTEFEFIVKARLKKEVEQMLLQLSEECRIELDKLSGIFSSVNISKQHKVLSAITKTIVSMPKADYSKYA